MGIGKLYFFGAGIFLASLLTYSHYDDIFDGRFHRWGPEAKERRRQRKKQKEEEHEQRIKDIAREKGKTPEEIKKDLKHERERTASYGKYPKQEIHEALRDRARSESHANHRSSRGRRDRRDSSSSSSSEDYERNASSRPRRSALKNDYKGARVAAESEWVTEEELAQYASSKTSRAPHRPRRDSHMREQRDFSFSNSRKPGRKGDFEAYKQFYGANDDQRHCFFPGEQ